MSASASLKCAIGLQNLSPNEGPGNTFGAGAGVNGLLDTKHLGGTSTTAAVSATNYSSPDVRVIGHPGKSIIWKFYFKSYFQTLSLFWIRK